MADKNGGRIKFGINFDVDNTSLNKLKKSLQDIQNIKLSNFKGIATDLNSAQEAARNVQIALEKAYNPTLGITNVQAFQKAIESSEGSIDNVYQKLKLAGPEGQAAFHRMATEVLTTNLKLKETNHLVQSMGKTMINTVKWGVASSIMNSFTGSVKGAFTYVQGLEKSLTNIRIVTGDSTTKMAQFAVQANQAAKALGRSTLDYTKSSLTFYQQGLSEQDVQARTEATLKAQNITGAGEEMADYLTAVWNGYKVANQEAELYVDKLAAVADSSASDMSELAIAMSKVASTANSLGVSADSLNAQIATVVATTRQAPESVGTAFKTVYARINDIVTGADEAEISLGNYSGRMAQLGFSVLDATGRLRQTEEVMTEIGERWGTLTKEQQIYLAQTMGGQRQVNQLMALFDNWTTYSELLNVSLEAEGTLAQKNARYMDSLEAKMEQFGAAGERVKNSLINEDTLKGTYEVLTTLTDLLGSFIDGIGGGGTALLGLASTATYVFKDVIARELNDFIVNFQQQLNNEKIKNQDIEATRKFGKGQGYKEGVIENLVQNKQKIFPYNDIMTEEETNQYNELIKILAAEEQRKVLLQGHLDEAKEFRKELEKDPDLAKQLNDNFQQTVGLLNEVTEDAKGIFEGYSTQDLLDPDMFAMWTNDELGTTMQNLRSNFGQEIVESLSGYQKLNQLVGDMVNSPAELTVENISRIKSLWNQMMKELSADVNNLGASEAMEGQLEIVEARMDNAQDSVNNFRKAIQQVANVRAFVNIVAGLGQVGTGLRTVANLYKVVKDENISTGQKIVQVFTSGSMALTMFANGLSNITKSFGSVRSSFEKFATYVNYARQNGITLTKALMVSEEELGAEYQVTGAKAVLSMGPYLAILAAVAAAIFLIVKAYQAWNKEADNAKKLAQVANDAKKSFDDTKKSVNDLKDALKDLRTAEDNLNNLTIGTKQWRDALQECNDKVLDLIAKYPELAQHVENVNGKLTLSEQGEKDFLQKAEQGLQNARNASLIASSHANQAESRAAAAAIGHNRVWYKEDASGEVSPSLSSADDVLKVAEAYNKAIQNGTADFSDNLNKLSQMIAGQTGLEEQQVHALLSSKTEMQQLRIQLQRNELADKLMYENMAQTALQEDSTYKGMNQIGKQVASAIAGSDLKNQIETLQDSLMNEMQRKMSRFSTTADTDVQDILTRLNKAQGTSWAMDSNAVRGGANNRTLAFLDENHQLQVLTAEQIASTIAAKEALEQLGNSAETAAGVLQEINNSGLSSSQQTGLKQFIAGNGINGTQQDVKDLLSLNMNEGTLQSIFGENYLQDIKNLGYDSAEDFIQAFKNQLEIANTDFQNIGQFVLEPVKAALNSQIKGQGFLLETEKNFEEAFSNVFERVGSSGIESLIAIKDLAGEDVDTVAGLFAQADLTTSKGLNLLEKDLQDIGAEAILASDEWKAFKKEVQSSQFENPIDSIFETQDTVNGITKDLKKYSIISEDDYSKLRELDAGVSSFFKRVAEGYEFIGSKPKLLELLVGTNPDYITAANQFDAIKDAALQVSEVVEEALDINKVDTTEGLSLDQKTGLVDDIINQVSQREDSSDIWAALGFDQEHIQTVSQEIQDLLNVDPSQRDQAWQSKYDDRLAILNEFIDKAKELPAYLQESTEALRSAAALNAQTMTELVGMLEHDDINGDQFGMALQTVSQREMSDLGFDPEKYEEYVKLLQATNEQYANNEYLARQVAAANMRISQGTQDLIDNWKDWDATFKDFLASGRDIGVLADKWGEFKETLANLFDMDKESFDLLGPNFVADNLDKIKAIKDGIPGAYEDLEGLIENELWGKLEDAVQNSGKELTITAGMDVDKGEIYTSSQQLFDQLQAISDDATIEVGTVVDDSNLIAGLNNMIDASNIASDEMASIFKGMGYDVEFQEKPDAIHQKSENVQYYVPPTYKMESLGNASLGFAGLSLPVNVPVIDKPGHYDSTKGEKETYQPGTYAIKTITKNGKGSGGNISRKKANAPSNNSSKGGKGGKGGGGKGKTPSQAKPATNKADRYRNNTVKANKLASEMTKLQKQSDRLSGKDKINNLEKQLQILEKQNRVIRERINLQRGQQAQLANNLKKYGATFDKDGTLNNYFAVHAKILDEYNKKVADWNSMSADDQQKNKDFLNNAKQIMDQALKDLQQYDKLQQEIAKSIQEQIDNAQEQINNKVQQLEIKIEATLDLAKLKRDWNAFRRDVVKELRDDDILGLNDFRFADINSYFNQGGTGSIQQLADKLATITKSDTGVFSASYLNEKLQEMTLKDREAQLKEIESILGSLTSEMTDFKELADEIKQSIFDAIDAAQAAFDEQMDEYEFLGDTLEHNKKLIQLMYGDEAYEAMGKYYDEIQKNNNSQLDFLAKEKDLWYGRMMEEQARMKKLAQTEGVDSNAYKESQDRFKEYEKHWMDSVKNLNATLEDALKNITDQYNNVIDETFLRYDKMMGNGHTLDDIKDEWDMLNDTADTYLDKINSAYEMEKLNNAFEDAIRENEGNIAAQQSLNDLMQQQLGYLRDKEKLTQYDVDRANTLLQIEIKRLALEQARSSKNRLRLRRDSQGNYTYQYTADTESINKAEQELADARNSLQNSDKAAYVDNLNAIQKSADTLKQKLEDIWKDQNLSKEQKLQKSYELQKYYGQQINDLIAENAVIRNNLMESSFEELARIYGISADEFRAMSKEQQNELMKDIVPQTGSYMAQWVDNVMSNGGYTPYFEQMVDQMAKADDERRQKQVDALDKAQKNMENITNDVDILTQQIRRLIEPNDELINKHKQEIEQVTEYIVYLNKVLDMYQKIKEDATAAASAAYAVLKADAAGTLGSTLERENRVASNEKKARESYFKKNNSASDLGPDYKPYQPEFQSNDYAAIFGSFSGDELSVLQKQKADEIKNDTTLSDKEKQQALQKQDSLFYTVTRDINISSVLDSIEEGVLNINTLLNSIYLANDTFFKDSLNKQDDIKSTIANQTISINADFPNAKDVQAIIQAIESLPAKAAQYAGKV